MANETPKDKTLKEHKPKQTQSGVGGSDLENVLKNLLAQFQTGGFPIKFVTTSPSPEEIDLMGKINNRLVGKNEIPGLGRRGEACIKPISVPFPECSDILLSLINTKNPTSPDEISGYFNDYFMFCDHNIVIDDARLNEVLDPKLLACDGKWFEGIKPSPCRETTGILGPHKGQSGGSAVAMAAPDPTCAQYVQTWPPKWPPFWCLPPSCVTLAGTRHLYPKTSPPPDPSDRIKRLFIADLVWLFYFERMGIFKILGVILDDFAVKGRIPISNGVISPGIKDDVVALVLESMVRKVESGLSSRVRNRDSSYRRCLNPNVA